MFLKNKKHSAFTLIELLVVIAIIGILATLAVVYLQASRANARDAKRVADVKQIQTALELYNNNNMGYPESLEELSSIDPQNNYMQTIPTAPTPCDGDCEPGDNTYTYNVSDDRTSYTIGTCIGKNVSDLNKGSLVASPSGIVSLGSGSSGNPPGGTGSFNCGDNLIDSRDSQSYPTVQIGTQCWFAENLAYLPSVQDATTFANNGNTSSSAYGVYDYTGTDVSAAKATANYKTYGVLYNWFAAVNSSDTNITGIIQGACPLGWHIPSDSEFNILATEDDGGKLKTTGETHWNSENEGATNSSGFSALPSGYRDPNGAFDDLGYGAGFWSSSFSSPDALGRYLFYDDAGFYSDFYSSVCGFAVRCLKD